MALNTFNQAASSALEEYLGRGEYTEDQVELVADLMEQARSVWSEDDTFGVLLLEKAASYVCADMTEEELDLWVDHCIDAISYYMGF
jgi:hypothetical protein